jgi:hypothetical protein
MAKRKILSILLIALMITATGKGWYYAKDGFSFRRIKTSLIDDGLSFPINEELQRALNQPFSYLSRGHQAYAFESGDGKYVLKLPRYDIYRPPLWMRCLPALKKKREKFLEGQNNRYDFLVKSFVLAFEEMQEETSLLYIHLHKTDTLNQKVKIIDQVGRQFTLDLDSTGFLLQKKQDLLIPLCREALKNKEDEKVKKMLFSYLEFNAARARKKIHNKDASFRRNFALDQDAIVQIDVGSFYRMDSQDFRTSFVKTVDPLNEWLQNLDPEIATWFSGEAEKIIREEG